MSETKRLVGKLAEVMAAVERVPKRGVNDFHKYSYATEADIASTVRAELAARQVMLIPAILGETRHPVGEKGSVLTVLEMEMEFIDGESGESIKKPWRGYGTDKEDKGGYKAMTGGEKYFLLKTFLMPTGDDPERDTPADKRRVKGVAPDPPATVINAATGSNSNWPPWINQRYARWQNWPISTWMQLSESCCVCGAGLISTPKTVTLRALAKSYWIAWLALAVSANT